MENGIEWIRVGTEAEALVQSVLDRARGFRWNTEGVKDFPDQARTELEALPPGRSLEDKFFLVGYCGAAPFAVADIIRDYPREGTAMLGLMLLDEAFQKRGLGRLAYGQLEAFMRDELRANMVRLGIAVSNPVQGFWEKMGFRFTGESRPHHGKNCESIVLAMEKSLDPSRVT